MSLLLSLFPRRSQAIIRTLSPCSHHRLSNVRLLSSDPYDERVDSRRLTALVLGSSGALGSSISRYLSKDLGVQVLGADILELPHDFTGEWELDGFVSLPQEADLGDLTVRLVRGVHYFLHGEAKLDAIICASGGWQPDPELSSTKVEERTEQIMEMSAVEYSEAIVRMRRMNLDPVLAAGYIAQQYMADEGLMVVLGATAALAPTPGMLGYGLAKAAAHHFTRTVGASTGKSLESKAMRKLGRSTRKNIESLDNLTVIGILPTTIDTPANRRLMPRSDSDHWTKPIDIAKEIGHWLEQPSLRPHSGSLVKVYPSPEGQGAVFELVR